LIQNINVNDINATAKIALLSNTLLAIGILNDNNASNYILTASNNLINKVRENDNNASNYILTSSNNLINKVRENDNNASNYILTSSNNLINKIRENDNNSSNYILTASNNLINKIRENDNNSSNYILTASNNLINKIRENDNNSSNYILTASNNLINKIRENDNNSSNYILITSNILSQRLYNLDQLTSNIVSNSISILNSKVTNNDDITSNLVLSTSNIISKRITDLTTDMINENTNGSKKFIVNNRYNNNLEVNGTLTINSNLIVLGDTTRLDTIVYTTERLEVVNANNTTTAFMVQQNSADRDIFVASNMSTAVFRVANNGDVLITGAGVYKKNNRDVIWDTSNYILTASNNLINKIRENDNNSSNYILTASNNLINKIRENDNNASNYILTASNNLINKIRENDNNSSNYVLTTSNLLAQRLNKYSLWEPISSSIYYNSGNVGIGTNSPTTDLHIYDAVISETKLTIQNNSLVAGITPSGGVFTTSQITGGGDKFVIFTAGTSSFTVPVGGLNCDILMIGGGGGSPVHSGGGAGACIVAINQTLPAGFCVVSVGDGGSVNNGFGTNGNDSYIKVDNSDRYRARGGGMGGSQWQTEIDGGCGGGGRFNNYNPEYNPGMTTYGGVAVNTNVVNGSTATIGPSITSTYAVMGNSGGNGNEYGSSGGGGGIGSTGFSSGPGGNGAYQVTLTGTATPINFRNYFANGSTSFGVQDGTSGNYYIGGGGGGRLQTGGLNGSGQFQTGGLGGGGGTGGLVVENTGSGAAPFGKGGSGIVIIRYRIATLPITLGNPSIELIRGITSDSNTDYKIGNYGGDFKIMSSTSNIDTNMVILTTNGNMTISGSVNATSYLLGGSNILIKVDETSNYVLSTSNNLIRRTDTNDRNASNYILTASNNLINKIRENDNNSSNYILTASNNLINKIRENDNNSSNYTLTASNNLINKIRENDNNSSNYILTASNNLINKIRENDNNSSNYILTASNNLIRRVNADDNNSSNYTLTASNNLINKIRENDENTSAKVTVLTNTLLLIDATNDDNMSNYVLSASNLISKRITDLTTDMITENANANKKFIVNNRYNNNLEVNGNLTVNSNLIILGDSTRLDTTVYTTERLEVVNANNTTTAFMVQQNSANRDIFVASNMSTAVFRIANNGDVNMNGVMTIKGDIIPSSNVAYNLGSVANRWKDLYLSGNSIYLNNTVLSSDSGSDLNIKDTSGTYKNININTLQLNRSGKQITLGIDETGRLTYTNASNVTSFAITTTSVASANLDTSILNVDKGGTGVGTLASGQLLFGNGTGNVLQTSNLRWDNTNKRLGIGTSAPENILHISDASTSNTKLTIQNSFVSSGSGSGSLPTEIIVAGAISSNIGINERFIMFPYSGSGTTKDYTFTTTENLVCDILVVGGGGGGGQFGGGGGGGSIIFGSNISISTGNSVSIKVGNGGTGSTNFNAGINGINGNDTSIIINTIEYIAKGGGGGGSRDGTNVGRNGNTGGSGGGGSTGEGGQQYLGGISNKNIYSNFISFGNNGGKGKTDINGSPGWASGGGGGAGSAGSDFSSITGGGNGGSGKEFVSYFGTSVGHNGWFGGGGGGNTYINAGNRGYGNGGNGLFGGGGSGGYDGGVEISADNGLANTGGGGGGSKYDGSGSINGGNGGSGVVIIRYRSPGGSSTAISSASIELIRGAPNDSNTDYKIGNYEGEFKIMSSTSNVDISRLHINSSGNIGIGTSAPIANLHITDTNTSNTKLTIQNNSISSTSVSSGSLPTEIVVAGAISSNIGINERYIMFPYSGTATSNSFTFTTTQNLICDILLVGGGGGGGYSYIGGGGGAGGYVYTSNVNMTAGNYTVNVGAGGKDASSTTGWFGGNGGNSSITGGINYTALGGGGGAGGSSLGGAFIGKGNNGGSGGGGSIFNAGGSGNGGTSIQFTTYGYGSGGDGTTYIPTTNAQIRPNRGGNGGGASGIPSDVSGGDGLANSITGVLVSYAGGGGGGNDAYVKIPGGLGGGGAGSDGNGLPAVAGADGFGGGGGGARGWASGPSAKGGSGIVIIRYRMSSISSSSSSASIELIRGAPNDSNTDYKIGNYEGEFKIMSSTSNVDISRLHINSSGNVGIGTSAPIANLHITDASINNTKLTIQNTFLSNGSNSKLPNQINVVGAISTNIGAFDRCIIFPYSLDNTGIGQTLYTITTTENLLCDILIVGGGGGGSAGHGGGGGAGQLVLMYQATLNSGTYTIKVGKGGNKTVASSSTYTVVTHATKGADSSFETVVAEGGGANGANISDKNGGSGAGGDAYGGDGGTSGAGNKNTTVDTFPGATVYSRGNNGGNNIDSGTGGGGGGAGQIGINGTNSSPYGKGGNGLSGISEINYDFKSSFGTTVGKIEGDGLVWFAGGGGGGGDFNTSGGLGGGGGGKTGYTNAGNNGDDGTGSGGGGGSGYSGNGGNGGSGIVIIKYRKAILPSSSSIIELIQGTSSDENTDYKLGNYSGDFKIMTSTSNIDINSLLISANGEMTLSSNLLIQSRIGIGTTSPSSKLEVYGGDIRLNTTWVAGAAMNVLGINTDRRLEFSFNNGTSLYDTNKIRFLTGTSLLERMVIDTSGNVGIGGNTTVGGSSTISGSATIAGNMNVAGTILFNMNWTGGVTANLMAYNADKRLEFSYNDGTALYDNNKLRFFTGPGVQPFPRMIIDTSGNVGIGTTTNLTNRLNVNGTASATLFSGSFSGTGNSLTNIPISGITDLQTTLNNTCNYILTTSNVLAQRINKYSVWEPTTSNIYYYSSGNVGIGTTAPVNKLHISDTVSPNTKMTIQNNNLLYVPSTTLPNVINVAGTISSNIGTTERYIMFPYSGTGTSTSYTFTITENIICDILVVGGGGGGGSFGGGGGGGDVIYSSNVLFASGTYTAITGAGGIGNTVNAGSGYNGYTSSIIGGTVSFSAAGGGGGGGWYTQPPASPLISGFSSGGGGGCAGGANTRPDTNLFSGIGGFADGVNCNGGGGGSSGNGYNASSTKAGNGGVGNSVSITGSVINYGGGGGGSSRINDSTTKGIGVDGGGDGGWGRIISGYGQPPIAGSPNTGGGGGGGGVDDGAVGGSGIVIIRYRGMMSSYASPISSASIELTRGLPGDENIDYKIGNYNGDFKIMSSTSNVDINRLLLTSNGDITVSGSIEAPKYLLGGRNILDDTSNYVLSTNNIISERIFHMNNDIVAMNTNTATNIIRDTSAKVTLLCNTMLAIGNLNSRSLHNTVNNFTDNTTSKFTMLCNTMLAIGKANDNNISNYIFATSNKILSAINANSAINATANNLEVNGNLTVNSNLIVLGDSTRLETTVYTTERMEIVNANNTTAALMVQQNTANRDIFVASNMSTRVFNIANNGDVNMNGSLTATNITGALNMANATSGTLAVARGGTGATTLTAGQVLIGNTTSALQTANLTWDIANSRLGIGTATPIRQLHVVGEIIATDNIISYYSDERLKTKIGDINEPLKIINKLNGFYYIPNELARINGITNTDKEIGLSAQDVQRVLPEIVNIAPFDLATDEEGRKISKSGENYLTMSYERLAPVFVEAIKELEQKNTVLEQKNTVLEQKNKDLSDKYNTLLEDITIIKKTLSSIKPQ